MRLVSPSGVRLSVSDERGRQLLMQGYKVPGESPEPAPAPKPVVRRTRRKKTDDS